MSTNLLFLPSVFEYAEVSSENDTVQQITILESIPISEKKQSYNWGFILFIFCFFIFIYQISYRIKLQFTMANDIFRNKDRESIFFESPGSETLDKYLFCIQSLLMFSIIIYRIAGHSGIISDSSPSGMFCILGIIFIFLVVFVVYKLLAYSIVGSVFFDKEDIKRWNSTFISILCLSGLVLFFPALILFFIESMYFCCIVFFILYLIFVAFIVFYKLFTLFFNKNGLLIYFILYLCTQEIIPLYLLYRGIVYIFIIAQRDIYGF